MLSKLIKRSVFLQYSLLLSLGDTKEWATLMVSAGCLKRAFNSCQMSYLQYLTSAESVDVCSNKEGYPLQIQKQVQFISYSVTQKQSILG